MARTLTPAQFKTVADIAYAEAGLVLVESKASMIASRLTKRMKSLRLKDLDSYFSILSSSQGDEEIPNLLSALTTNVSHFFREEHHYEIFKNKVLPDLKKKALAGEKVRIWSAGCSSGQEVYSLAMTLFESFPNFSDYNIRLLATDIDPKILEIARAGLYNEEQIKSLPHSLSEKYFKKYGEDGDYQIAPRLRNSVSFNQLNLIRDWPMRNKFDVIFCRNVVIYFDEPTQLKLWPRFSTILKPDGWLFVGHSERVQDPESCQFETAGITAYRKTSDKLTLSTS